MRSFARRWRRPGLGLLIVSIVVAAGQVGAPDNEEGVAGALDFVGLVIRAAFSLWVVLLSLLLPVVIIVEALRVRRSKRTDFTRD